jgi:hypothetical protein
LTLKLLLNKEICRVRLRATAAELTEAVAKLDDLTFAQKITIVKVIITLDGS